MDAHQREQRIMALCEQAAFNREPFLRVGPMRKILITVSLAGVRPRREYADGGDDGPRPAGPVDPLWRQHEEAGPNRAAARWRLGSRQSGTVILNFVSGPKAIQTLYLPAHCRAYSLIALVNQWEQNALQGFCAALHAKVR